MPNVVCSSVCTIFRSMPSACPARGWRDYISCGTRKRRSTFERRYCSQHSTVVQWLKRKERHLEGQVWPGLPILLNLEPVDLLARLLGRVLTNSIREYLGRAIVSAEKVYKLA